MRCILHIGTEKTATTLLQDWLYDNHQQLSHQGVALTHSSGYTNNRKLVAYFMSNIDSFLHVKGIFSHAEKDEFYQGYETAFQEEIDRLKTNHHTCILTSEHFHSRLRDVEDIQKLKDFLSRFFDEIEIICYFREQSALRTSLYSTALKVETAQSLEDFQGDAAPPHHYYNYVLFFGKWEKVFGKESLVPRVFSKPYLTDGDIRMDFLTSVLPQVDTKALNFEITSANLSLCADQALFYRAINQAKPEFIGKFTDPAAKNLKDVIDACAIWDHEKPMTDPRQQAMYDIFDASNRQFFSRYFGQEQNLFEAPIQATPQDIYEKRFSLSQIVQLISRISEMNNFVVMRPREVDRLHMLASRLHEEDAISKEEALLLMQIASRARPSGPRILAKLDRLHEFKQHARIESKLLDRLVFWFRMRWKLRSLK